MAGSTSELIGRRVVLVDSGRSYHPGITFDSGIALDSPRTLRALGKRSRDLVKSWAPSAWLVGALSGAVALVFDALRILVAGGGQITRLIIVGSDHAHGAGMPRGVIVSPGTGYDGQFYFRLALDPLAWSHQAFGITLDTTYRIGRIGYPALAWLIAGGHAFLVPYTLVVANALAFGALAGFAVVIARDAGRAPLAGLLLAGYWGFLWTLARDLTELVAAAALLGALIALRRGAPLLAGLALSVGVLSRETVLVLVLAVFAARVLHITFSYSSGRFAKLHLPSWLEHEGLPGLFSSRRPARIDIAWFLPGLAFVGWQWAVRVRTGTVPLLASGQSNRSMPFAGLVDGIRYRVPHLPSTASVLWSGELLVLLVVVVLAASAWRSSNALLHERLAWVGYGVLAASLSPQIWSGDVGFRSLDELFLLSAVLLMFSSRRMFVPGLLVSGAWMVVFVELVRFI